MAGEQRLKRLRDQAKKATAGTPLEFPLRRIDRAVRRQSAVAARGVEYDRLTVEVMRRVLADGDRAVDVGAHEGTLLRWMIRASPGGDHVAVEPIPSLAAGLRRDFPSVRVEQVALTDREGTSTFRHVVDRPAISGLVSDHTGEEEIDELFDVAVTTLDNLVSDGPVVRFIKVDVEGAELGVFRGARSTIERSQPFIAFEHGPIGEGPTSEVHRLLVSELGLHVSTLADWLAGRPPLSEGELLDAQRVDRHFFFLAHPRRTVRS